MNGGHVVDYESMHFDGRHSPPHGCVPAGELHVDVEFAETNLLETGNSIGPQPGFYVRCAQNDGSGAQAAAPMSAKATPARRRWFGA